MRWEPETAVSRRGLRWIALYTALPVTVLTPVHAGAGLSSMAPLGFTGAVFVGLLPRTAIYSFFGDSLAQESWTRLAVAVVILAVCTVVGVAVARRIGNDATRDDPEGPS